MKAIKYNTSVDKFCDGCGKVISGRARANVWHGEQLLCSSCFRKRKQQADLEARIHGLRGAMVGWPDKLWLVHDGAKQWGPYTTEQLIELLRQRRVDWLWNVWREGMREWRPVGRLFTIPEFADDGQIRLREFVKLNEPKP